MKILAIIPARSGSKGLKDKNIKLLNGKHLIGYSIEEAIKSNVFEDIIVSTDSEKYAEIAKKYGATVPFLRTEELSNDTSKVSDVILDIIQKMEELGKKYDCFMLLQPTSPLRTANDIIKSLNLYNDKSANVVVSVSEAEHSPLWMNTIDEDLSMSDFIKVVNTNRQELKKYYRINGAIYLSNIEFYKKTKNFFKGKSFAYIMEKSSSIDIDDIYDFTLAEILLNIIREN